MALTNAERQAKHRAQQARLTYAGAIKWLVLNDDCAWSSEGGPVSVTAGFVADCYGRTAEEVRRDLTKSRTQNG